MNHARLLLVLPLAGLTAVIACSSSSSSTPETDAGVEASSVEAGSDADTPVGTMCSAARTAALPPIKKVATGEVKVLSDVGGTKTIYVDASAGGFQGASTNPRLYLNLETAARVDVTDEGALASSDWDLALKRVAIFTNSGDGGPGVGGAAAVLRDFASVTAADADDAKPEAEHFFDENCELQKDPLGGPYTTFSAPPPYGWYDYDDATMVPSPRPEVTYIVKGGTGKRFKVAIRAYDALPDGGSRKNASTGFFVLEVAAL